MDSGTTRVEFGGEEGCLGTEENLLTEVTALFVFGIPNGDVLVPSQGT